MSSFRKPYKYMIVRHGGYTDGVWSECDGIERSFMASVQPISSSECERVSAALEGRRVVSGIRIYTATELPLPDEGVDHHAVVFFMGKKYLVVFKGLWQSGVISHFKYTAIEEIVERR